MAQYSGLVKPQPTWPHVPSESGVWHRDAPRCWALPKPPNARTIIILRVIHAGLFALLCAWLPWRIRGDSEGGLDASLQLAHELRTGGV